MRVQILTLTFTSCVTCERLLDISELFHCPNYKVEITTVPCRQIWGSKLILEIKLAGTGSDMQNAFARKESCSPNEIPLRSNEKERNIDGAETRMDLKTMKRSKRR